jgi:6,7-dimethyl-8-ribityllumazine synthase
LEKLTSFQGNQKKDIDKRKKKKKKKDVQVSSIPGAMQIPMTWRTLNKM